jgi:hypothetical protein
MSDAAATSSDWPGKRLGLPASGPRSVARFGRRLAAIAVDWALATAAGYLLFPGERFAPLVVFAALFIDWAIAWVISVAFFPTEPWQSNPWLTLGIFAAEQLIFLWTVNGGVGHLLLRMRVVPVVPGRLGWWRPIVRTLLLCLAVPALIWDRDQRGLHDRAAGTMLVRV